MKKKKLMLKNLKKKYLLFCFLAILFIILILYFSVTRLFSSLNNNYKIETRVENIINERSNDTDIKKTVGWLKVQGTNIDYPILYAPYYNFSYETSDFAWTEGYFKDLNNIIYITGHNIKNQSKHPLIGYEKHNRFEQLMSFIYYDFSKENEYFQYTFNGNDYVYKIYSVAFINSDDLDVYNDSKYSSEKLSDYIKLTKESSLFDYEIDVNSDDKILSLITCTRFLDDQSISFVVTGRLLRKNENTKKYNVKTNHNYDKINEILKGGDSDEDV